VAGHVVPRARVASQRLVLRARPRGRLHRRPDLHQVPLGPEGPRSPGHDWSDTMRELTETDQTTQMGYEFYPRAIGGAIRRAHRSCPGVPILVTENGIATTNDDKRIAYIDAAMREVLTCMGEGIDVRSYLYWSLLDNFEWTLG